ncbi:MAG TPA: sulfite exporter TauE/SafE family protein [Solirubrobacteraceae bacterium]|nr:sulfite exporter TauE/SafE family protein [Solirubrobacteraceae bacterium]
MVLTEALGLCAAGFVAGVVNVAVGGGTLITFPALLAFGLPPVLANVTNTFAAIPGLVTGAFGYRRELRGELKLGYALAGVSASGGLLGAWLLRVLPRASFTYAAPACLALAVMLIGLEPYLGSARGLGFSSAPADRRLPVLGGILVTGVYGGYFGAAQAIVAFAVLKLWIARDARHLGALKVLCSCLSNVAAAAVFVWLFRVSWLPAGLIGLGGVIGGLAGARCGRRISARAMRLLSMGVGALVVMRLLV